MLNLTFTETINIILTVIQLLLIVTATVFGLSQLKENTRARQADVIDRVFEYVTSKNIREARKSVRKMKPFANISRLSNKQIENIELVLVGWARVGVLLQLETFSKRDKHVLFQTYSWSIIDSWERLAKYVFWTREKVGMPDYWLDFEVLAQNAKSWRTKHKLPIPKGAY